MLLIRKDRNEVKEASEFISVFSVVRAHKKKSRLRTSPVSNGWFGRSVENVANVSSVEDDDQKDCECCPAPRSGHRIFVTEDFMYMIGGYRPGGRPDRTFTDVWRFNLLTEKWQKCPVVKGLIPDCLASFSLVQTDRPNEVYAFGGTGDVFVNSYDENQRATPIIYLVGGTTGHDYNIDVWKLQLSGKNDETRPSKSAYHNESGRYRLEVIFHEDQLIAFGGGAPDFCAEFDELLVFDLGTQAFDKIRTIADEEHGYPEGRKCHAVVEFHGEVIIIGGCREFIRQPTARRECKMTNDVWRLNLASMRWTKLDTSLPVPIFFHSAAVTSEGCVYVLVAAQTSLLSLALTKSLGCGLDLLHFDILQ
uniref:Kelch domain-containing protein 10 n=1 Tax=Ditylenchus dipsaci TaxID=166011 RepID=A0A915CVC9_9BILA